MPPIALLSQHLVCTGQLVAPDAAALARLLLLAPVLEEWVVRAGLQEWLIRRTALALLPVVVSAAAFALLHVGSGRHAAGLVLAPGLALALLYQHGRDWRWCALAHCGMNALALGGCAL
ncbi:JDVT-CTERM system glutamic-type intramembrane protease [Telluria mixta]|uniref:JDVT-CTERM system glutamic-type intramembrane protease n=1 Tax=Telluria mixta TaxID=34071 RepID=A0ABT2BY40_9BURK|nr:JDVT-CTERM system glutamic-type intramembrane protease [Telluria mixta]MCS0629344.1 JDVT-CTERM system glutamic-type intramembrane protease [Telluria mixta]WEM97778.1 JDVT-CTERM system glutamic-type intramembrane protease [Telluria mixta]